MTHHENAKYMIIQYYEQIAGVNLYGNFPDRSIWKTQKFKLAVNRAINNARTNGHTEIIEAINDILK
jgi:hypothetical protein